MHITSMSRPYAGSILAKSTGQAFGIAGSYSSWTVARQTLYEGMGMSFRDMDHCHCEAGGCSHLCRNEPIPVLTASIADVTK